MNTKCVNHQCGTCGRYVRAETVAHSPGYGVSGDCPQHGVVDVHCGARPDRSRA